MIKKILLLLLLVIVILGAILSYNALKVSSKQISAKPAADIKIPENAVKHLSEAIQIETISYEDVQDRDTVASQAILDYIQKTYPLVDSLLKKEVIAEYSLLYTWQGTDKNLAPIILLAHTDVVPIEGVPREYWKKNPEKPTEQSWKYPPFSGTIAEDYIWGRGSLDDKMNVFGILEAVEMLLGEGFQSKRTIYLAFGHDEEVGGKEGAKKIAENLQKKGVKAEFILDEGLFILKGLVPGVEKPVAYIGAAEKGFVNIELSVLGEGGHSSRPPLQTPIGILSQAIVSLESHPFTANIDGASQAMLEYLTPEMPFLNRLAFNNRWLFESVLISQMSKKSASNAILRTTIAPTMLEGSQKANVLPIRAKVTVNFRIKPGETSQTVLAHVNEVVGDERVKANILSRGFDNNNPIPISDINSTGFKVLHQTIKEIFPGVLVSPALMIAGTDSKHFYEISQNIYRFSPVYLREDELASFHGKDERVSIQNFKKTIHFYHQLIGNFGK
jgi:carboxypeptidase PM20D1